MPERIQIKLEKNDYIELFKFLINNNFNKSTKSWISEENGRLNKKFLFDDKHEWKDVIPNKYHKTIKFLIKKIKNYKSPFGEEKKDFLERIQVIESNYKNNLNLNNKGQYLYNLHCDKINSYKAIVFFSNVKIKDGPIYFAEVARCHEQVKNKLKEMETKKKKIPWNKINSTVFCKYETPILANIGDVIIFDGREPHRASLLKNKGFRALIIFELMTKKNSKLYRNSF